MKAAENQDFISQGSTNNATCFIGPHRLFDPFTRSFMNLVPGQGHFGPDAIPGDARWRRGMQIKHRTYACHTKPNNSLAANSPSRTQKIARGIRVAQNGSRHNGPHGARATCPNGLLEGLSVQVIGDARIASAWCRDKTAGIHLHWVSLSCVRVGSSWLFGNFLACVRARVLRFLTLKTGVPLFTLNTRFACE